MKTCENCLHHDKRQLGVDECAVCVTAYVNYERQTPSHWTPIPQTNADRIRAMSDEELAVRFGGRCLCTYIQDETDFCESRAVCRDCIVDWLRQPVKDGEDE